MAAQKITVSLNEQVKQAGFVTVGEGVYLNTPPKDGDAMITSDSVPEDGPDSHPDVILIFGWMGSSFRPLSHYAKGYANLYPGAAQIIVQSYPSYFWELPWTRDKRVAPVVEALKETGFLTNSDAHIPRRKILTHIFSNGGALQATTLSSVLRKSGYHPPAQANPARSAVFFDSVPGVGNFGTIKRAFTLAVPDPFWRALALLYMYSFIIGEGVTSFWLSPFGYPPPTLKRMKEALEEPAFLPWVSRGTPRTYVWSKGDEIVPWWEVKRHAARVREYKVSERVRDEEFEGSAHVAHMVKDRKRYWDLVQDVWRASYREDK